MKLETRGHFRRLLFAAGDALGRLLLPAPRRVLDHERPDLLDPDDIQTVGPLPSRRVLGGFGVGEEGGFGDDR